jgi:hypothetical protein
MEHKFTVVIIAAVVASLLLVGTSLAPIQSAFAEESDNITHAPTGEGERATTINNFTNIENTTNNCNAGNGGIGGAAGAGGVGGPGGFIDSPGGDGDGGNGGDARGGSILCTG